MNTSGIRRNEKGQFERGNSEGRRFSSSYQPVKNGRKRTIFNQVTKKLSKKGYDLSKEEFFEIMAHIIELSPAELKKIVKDEATPVWIVVMITSLLTDCRYGRLGTLGFILDRILGKTHDNVRIIKESSIKIKQDIDLSKLSEEENAFLDQIFDKLILSGAK